MHLKIMMASSRWERTRCRRLERRFSAESEALEESWRLKPQSSYENARPSAFTIEEMPGQFREIGRLVLLCRAGT